MTATKILCTLGPATDAPGMVRALAEAGMDAARLNFSHGGEEAHRPRVQAVREAERELGRPIALLADLPGPKIRLGRFPGGPVELKENHSLVLQAGDGPCDKDLLTVDYPSLAQAVRPGGDIFLADGFLHLRVERIDGGQVHCRIVRGGVISDRKGVNLPGVPLDLPTLTDRDYRDALAAARLGCDLLALSFVRGARDIETLRAHLQKNGANLPIVAKLERPEAIEHLDDIIAAADAVMVARGDLGVEVGVERVPVLQKHILAQARRHDKPAIVATQMLESMTLAPVPTRAEASDVANAILDGADVVMLSGETAAGRYPLETVRMMKAIAERAEPLVRSEREGDRREAAGRTPQAVVDGVLAMVQDLQPRLVVAYTTSGFTPRLLSKRRPSVPIAAITPHDNVQRLCQFYYGCIPLLGPALRHVDEIAPVAARLLVEKSLVRPGDCLVLVAGLPFNTSGATNLIHVHRVEAS